MKIKIILLILIISNFLIIKHINASEVAILPYKVNNPSKYFPKRKGKEYAKLLSCIALIKKKITVTSPRDIDIDLRRLKINPNGIITGHSLYQLGKTRYLDYILSGTITKAGGTYISRSVLYSVSEKKVILKINKKSKNLFKLARSEVNEAFVRFDDIIIDYSKSAGTVDTVFIVDLSYSINKDWGSIKYSIINFVSRLIDRRGIDSKICVIPFSDRLSTANHIFSENSVRDIKKGLKGLNPVGGTSYEGFTKALRYAVKSVRWRRGASKKIIVIANSDINRARQSQNYAYMAGRMGIKINTISLGHLQGDKSEIVRSISSTSGGVHKHVSYYQKMYDKNASPINIYYENGRMFKSREYDRSWRDGLLEGNKYDVRYGKPRGFLSELFFDASGIDVNPYFMPKFYRKISGHYIINQKGLENNINTIMQNMTSSFFKAGKKKGKRIGKVLLSNGKVSFWAYIDNEEKSKFYRNKSRARFYFPLGIVIRKNRRNAYGLSFIPKIFNVASGYIPRSMMTTLKKIIKRKHYYMTRGLFYPPIWFVKVKVERVRLYKGVIDIRD